MSNIKIYSAKLTHQQNKALTDFENLTLVPIFGIDEFESGEISAKELWNKNFDWLEGIYKDVQQINFKV